MILSKPDQKALFEATAKARAKYGHDVCARLLEDGTKQLVRFKPPTITDLGPGHRRADCVDVLASGTTWSALLP